MHAIKHTLEVVLLTFACSKNEADPQTTVEPLPAPKESPHPSAPQLEAMVSSPLGSLLLQGLPEWASLFHLKGSFQAVRGFFLHPSSVLRSWVMFLAKSGLTGPCLQTNASSVAGSAAKVLWESKEV